MTDTHVESFPARRPRIARNGSKPKAARVPHVITVTSGKGGVGKTNFTANLAWQLRQLRRSILILDADLGLANIDIVLGLTCEFNLSHVISGEKRLQDILTKGPAGIRVLPAGSGVTAVTHLTDVQKIHLMEELESLENQFDFVLIDTSAGIADNVIYFNLAAQTIIIIVTPEPTSLTDAYALIKILSRQYHQRHFKVVANDVTSEKEGMDVFANLTRVTDRFLNVSLDYLGHIAHDVCMRDAVRMQRPFCEVYDKSPATHCIQAIARRVVALQIDPMSSDLGFLWRNILVKQGVA